MMKKLLTAFLAVIVTNLHSQSFEFSWAQAIKGNGIANCQNIATDLENNVYAIGTFNEAQDFSGDGTTILETLGGHNFYLIKRNTDGDFLWAVAFEDTPNSNVTASDVVIDNTGSIIVAGEFNGSIDFDPGLNTNIISSIGNSQAYLCKFDANGIFIEAISFGGSSDMYLPDIEIDSDNNIYCTGTSIGAFTDFDPSDANSNTPTLGSADVYVSKLDSAFNLIWVKLFGGEGVELGSRICINPNNNLLILAAFQNEGDYDPGDEETIFTPTANNNSVIVKLSSDGDFIWAKVFMPSSNSSSFSANGISANQEGIYLSGTVSGTVDFDPNIGIQNYTQTGMIGIDGFVLKLSPAGDFQFLKNTENGIGGFLKVNSTTVCATGQIISASDIDPNAGVNFITNNGGQQGYLIILNNEGETLSSNVPPVSERSDAMAICFDSENAVVVCGSFLGNGNLETSFGDSVITANWSDSTTTYDPYIYKLSYQIDIGIREALQKNINVYPIPADKIINIDSEIQRSSIQIFDAIGKLKVEFSPTITSYDVSNLSNGIYLLKINFADGKSTYKNFTIAH